MIKPRDFVIVGLAAAVIASFEPAPGCFYTIGIFVFFYVVVRGIIWLRQVGKENEAAARAAAEQAAKAEADRQAAEAANLRAERIKRAAEAQRLADLYNKPYTPPAVFAGGILSYQYPDFEIASFDAYLDRLKKIPPQTRLEIAPEPTNPHNPKAVALYSDGRVVGYFYANQKRDMVRDYLDRPGRSVLAVTRPFDSQPMIGLYFYRAAGEIIRRLADQPGAREFTLTGNRAAEYQETLGLSSVGEPVDIEYDPAEDRYIASAGGEIGKFPRTANKFLAALHGYYAVISDLDGDDDEKYTVTVLVAPEAES